MSPIRYFALVLMLMIFWGSAVVAETPTSQANGDVMTTSLSVTVGDSRFIAILYDNEATRALLSRLPLTLTLNELHGNEKYATLPQDLPSNAKRVERIHTGDLMLYGTDCLVLFYDDFTTSYRYTPLGRIENSTGLATILGRDRVRVTFAVVDP